MTDEWLYGSVFCSETLLNGRQVLYACTQTVTHMMRTHTHTHTHTQFSPPHLLFFSYAVNFRPCQVLEFVVQYPSLRCIIVCVILSKVDGIFFFCFYSISTFTVTMSWLCFCFLIAGLRVRVGFLLNASVIIVILIAWTILRVFQSTGARSLRGEGPLALAGCATSRLFSADSGQ